MIQRSFRTTAAFAFFIIAAASVSTTAMASQPKYFCAKTTDLSVEACENTVEEALKKAADEGYGNCAPGGPVVKLERYHRREREICETCLDCLPLEQTAEESSVGQILEL